VQRSEALQSLSRDHHRALVVAKTLERADDVDQAATLFLGYWNDHGRAHFRIEEEVLLPFWDRLGTVDGPALNQLAREHLEIRARALAVAEDPSLDTIHDLGRRLASHIRFEERKLFPLIENDLDPTGLERLATAVAQAEERV
jgi:hemerythrin-like domain-containing protein